MAATTYQGAGVAVPADVPAKKRKPLWARVLNAVADGQKRRAERELARYSYLLPRDYDLTQARREDEPFGGW